MDISDTSKAITEQIKSTVGNGGEAQVVFLRLSKKKKKAEGTADVPRGSISGY